MIYHIPLTHAITQVQQDNPSGEAKISVLDAIHLIMHSSLALISVIIWV